MKALAFLGLWLAATPAQAGEATISATDVRAICDAVAPGAAGRAEALAGVYTMTFPAKTFRLMPYDLGRSRVAIDEAAGFRGEGWELTMHGLVPGKLPAGALPLAFPASTNESVELSGAHRDGRLSLVVVFQPAASGDGTPPCAVSHSLDGDGIRLAIEPLAFELRRGSERVASAESARYAALRDETAPGPVTAPRVVVQPAMRTAAGGPAAQAMTRAAVALQPKLLSCYRLGLALEPTLRGSFVAGVDVGADGRVSGVRAEIDGLGARAVTGCILAEMRAAHFPKGPDRLSIPMRFGSAE